MAAFDGEVAAAAGAVNAADGALVALTARALAEGRWEGDRIHTPSQWLALRAGLSRHKAHQVVRLARRAGELPTVVRLLSDGRLSLDQASAVARHTPAAYEASVAELALHATVAQIIGATRQYAFDSDAPADDADPIRGPERSVTFGTDGAQWSGRVRLPADEGAVVEAALAAARDRLHDEARAAAKAAAVIEGGTTVGTDADLGVAPVGWADALVGMAKAALGTGGAGAEVDVRIGVLVHLEAPGPADPHGDRWRASMHGGPALPPAMRRFLTCD